MSGSKFSVWCEGDADGDDSVVCDLNGSTRFLMGWRANWFATCCGDMSDGSGTDGVEGDGGVGAGGVGAGEAGFAEVVFHDAGVLVGECASECAFRDGESTGHGGECGSESGESAEGWCQKILPLLICGTLSRGCS